MYRLKEKIEKAREFITYRGGLIYTVYNKLFIYNTGEEILISENFKDYCASNGIRVTGDRVIISDTWGNGFIAKVGEWQFKDLPYLVHNTEIVKNKIVISMPEEFKDGSEPVFSSWSGLYDLETGKLSKHFFSGVVEWIDGCLYTKTTKDVKVTRIDIDTGKEMWQVDISRYKYIDIYGKEAKGELVNYIMVYNNQLWLLIAKRRILILDNDTGEVIYYIKDFVGDLVKPNMYIGFKNYFIYPKRWQVDRRNKKLHLLYSYFYFQIDIETKEIVLLKSYLDSEDKWYFKYGYLKDGKMYFHGNIGYKMFAGRLGVFDVKTREVIWEGYDIEHTSKFWVGKIEVTDNLLISRASGETLYIFEKEK